MIEYVLRVTKLLRKSPKMDLYLFKARKIIQNIRSSQSSLNQVPFERKAKVLTIELHTLLFRSLPVATK